MLSVCLSVCSRRHLQSSYCRAGAKCSVGGTVGFLEPVKTVSIFCQRGMMQFLWVFVDPETHFSPPSYRSLSLQFLSAWRSDVDPCFHGEGKYQLALVCNRVELFDALDLVLRSVFAQNITKATCDISDNTSVWRRLGWHHWQMDSPDFSFFFSCTADATFPWNVCKNYLQRETSEMEIGWIFNNSPFFFLRLWPTSISIREQNEWNLNSGTNSKIHQLEFMKFWEDVSFK